MTPIFLDHASTTPIDPAVAAAMDAVLRGPLGLGNPSSSTHAYGRQAAAAIETARAQVAALIGAAPQDLLFTSGATESDNLAVLGVARGRENRGRHLVTSRIEHKAVLDPCRQLEKRGWQISWIEPQADGRIDPGSIARALRAETQLVSIMHANNETGVVQDIAAIAALCRAHGVLMHCDAAQTAGRLPLEVTVLGVDLLSFSAHKLYGPKGVGALWVAPRARPWLEPLMWGGGQERGLRPGTAATHQIIGFGCAAELARQRRDEDAARVESLAMSFRASLDELEDISWNDHPQHRLPGLVSLSIGGVEGESLLEALPSIAVSTGAACDSSVGEPSYVLRAQGVSAERAQSTLRITFGRFNTPADAALAAEAILAATRSLRARDAAGSPAGQGWFAGEAGTVREAARIRCYLQVDAQDRIAAMEFRAFTCPAVWRVLEALRAAALGQPIAAWRAAHPWPVGGPREWAHTYCVPTEKLGRLLRVEDAMRSALEAAGGFSEAH
jgi:cysteine desulfurase